MPNCCFLVLCSFDPWPSSERMSERMSKDIMSESKECQKNVIIRYYMSERMSERMSKDITGFKDSTFWYVQNKANSEHMVSCGFIM